MTRMRAAAQIRTVSDFTDSPPSLSHLGTWRWGGFMDPDAVLREGCAGCRGLCNASVGCDGNCTANPPQWDTCRVTHAATRTASRRFVSAVRPAVAFSSDLLEHLRFQNRLRDQQLGRSPPLPIPPRVVGSFSLSTQSLWCEPILGLSPVDIIRGQFSSASRAGVSEPSPRARGHLRAQVCGGQNQPNTGICDCAAQVQPRNRVRRGGGGDGDG